MLALVNTAYIPVSTQPLVNTAIPENIAQRVPYDNVAPPVSSPRTEPDARGNRQFFSSSPIPTASQTPPPEQTAYGKPLSGAPFGAPATLLAQLIGQPVPQQTSNQLRTILSEYEKLLTNSQIKYLPSNAGRPAAEPAGAFSRLLAQPAKQQQATRSENRINTSSPAESAEDDGNYQDVAPARTAATMASNAYRASAARNKTLEAVS
ncbi:MAG: hypothetical protein AB7L92_04935 [Alphaproteobacteria bacterium]